MQQLNRSWQALWAPTSGWWVQPPPPFLMVSQRDGQSRQAALRWTVHAHLPPPVSSFSLHPCLSDGLIPAPMQHLLWLTATHPYFVKSAVFPWPLEEYLCIHRAPGATAETGHCLKKKGPLTSLKWHLHETSYFCPAAAAAVVILDWRSPDLWVKIWLKNAKLPKFTYSSEN